MLLRVLKRQMAAVAERLLLFTKFIFLWTQVLSRCGQTQLISLLLTAFPCLADRRASETSAAVSVLFLVEFCCDVVRVRVWARWPSCRVLAS